jgi:hypothetical protein
VSRSPGEAIDREALYEALVSTKARLEPGLTVAELDAIEERFGFEFPPDVWMMLSLALPRDSDHSHGWTDWRHASDEVLREALRWPIAGLLGHVNLGLWWRDWGPRPGTLKAATAVARRALEQLPQLVPVRAYHYISSKPSLPGNAVFLCHETDAFVCSLNLLDFLAGGCSQVPPRDRSAARNVPFWSDFAARGAAS